VALSADNTLDDLEQFLDAGCNAFAAKPISVEECIRAMQSTL
jgi:CheY-like chemotaxis protein